MEQEVRSDYNELVALCRQKDLDIVAVKKFRRDHKNLTVTEIVDHCSNYKKYMKKPERNQIHVKCINEKCKSELELKCNYLYLPYNTVADYKNRHPELTDEQILKYYISRNNVDYEALRNAISMINGITPIEVLKLLPRELRCLKRIGVDTVEQMNVIPLRVLKQTYGIGTTSLQNIYNQCLLYGIKLREY